MSYIGIMAAVNWTQQEGISTLHLNSWLRGHEAQAYKSHHLFTLFSLRCKIISQIKPVTKQKFYFQSRDQEQ